MTTRVRAVRNAALGFSAHGALTVAVLLVDRACTGGCMGGWSILRIFQGTVEWPVMWAIDRVFGSFVILPIAWFYPHFDVAYAVNVALTYVLIGGIFYAAVAAAVTVLVGRWKRGKSG
jgi:hypothetical protein